jgi:hypothetical protein
MMTVSRHPPALGLPTFGSTAVISTDNLYRFFPITDKSALFARAIIAKAVSLVEVQPSTSHYSGPKTALSVPSFQPSSSRHVHLQQPSNVFLGGCRPMNPGPAQIGLGVWVTRFAMFFACNPCL